MQEIKNGFRIRHEWLAQKKVVEATYDRNSYGGGRLRLSLDGQEVYLSEEETGYFLAWMATWYGEGE